MRKNLRLGLVVAFVFSVSAPGAEAQTISQVSPAVLHAFSTQIKGSITVPASAASGELTGFKCSDLIVTATSKELKSAPPGTFAAPKWTRSTPAGGTWASGQCTYALVVPGEQEFALTAMGSGPYDCAIIDVWLANTPAWQTVRKNMTKTDNVTVKLVRCIPSV